MTWSVEIESPVSAARMFEAAVFDWHNLGPQIIPGILESASVEGLIREFTFKSGVMPYTKVKEFMNYVNYHDLECILTTMEGGQMETKLKFEYTRYKIEPARDGSGGCIVKVVTTTEPLKGVDVAELERDIDMAKDAVVKQFKAAEAFLLANPDDYVVIRTRGEKDQRTRGWMDSVYKAAGYVYSAIKDRVSVGKDGVTLNWRKTARTS